MIIETITEPKIINDTEGQAPAVTRTLNPDDSGSPNSTDVQRLQKPNKYVQLPFDFVGHNIALPPVEVGQKYEKVSSGFLRSVGRKNNSKPAIDCDGTDLSQMRLEAWREYLKGQDWTVPKIGSAVSKVIAAAYRSKVAFTQAVDEIHDYLVSIRAERNQKWLRRWALDAWFRVYSNDTTSLKGGLIHG